MYVSGLPGLLDPDVDHLALRIIKDRELCPVRKFGDNI